MRERTEADYINSRKRNVADIVKRYISARFELCASRRYFNSLFHVGAAHVVEHDNVGFTFECFKQFLKIARFDLDFEHMSRLFAERVHSVRDAAVSVDVVVLEHCRVGKVIAVIASAAHNYRIFLQSAESRKRLARIAYRSVRTLDRSYAFSRICRDPAHVLEQIQRGALAFKESGCFSAEFRDNIAFFDLR